ncbi:dual specificity protein phosphatase 23 [Anaeramoeba ignava]|uniref:Dual specificity protein phosphatase 23 n=1 Tax=Anaeramoeba ignava TaxID=1746090 RepID=A0A9Q0RHU6_ANAIG|nr:dual specificity protein phosphatase 23 [Anaeramoeba ignava]
MEIKSKSQKEESKRGSLYEIAKSNKIAFLRNKQPQPEPFFFSWVVENKLAGMGFPCFLEQFITLKDKYGVGLVVSCIEEYMCPPLDMFEKTNLQSILINWADRSTISIKQMIELTDQMDEVIQKNEAVVVHCFGGKGRTGTALACYLIAKLGFGGKEAIELVREKRNGSIETESQEKFIIDFYNKLNPDKKQEYLVNENQNFLKIKLRPIKK